MKQHFLDGRRLAGALFFGGIVLGGCGSTGSEGAAELGAFSPENSWEQGLSVSASKGLVWQRDSGFLIAGHTVPTLLILDNGYRMFSSAPQRGQIATHFSTDGVQWEPGPNLELGAQSEACPGMALDLSVLRVSGGYQLIVETWANGRGLMDPTGLAAPQRESPTRFCTWTSTDGDLWVPGGPLRWKDAEATWPSGLEGFQSEGVNALYYVDTHPELDGIRRAQLQGDAVLAGARKTVLPEAHVDPNPVHLLEGGVRLYHTQVLAGALAYADSKDGLVFGNSVALKGLSGQLCYTPPERPSAPDACFLDPFFIRLPDNRQLLYFSLFETLPGGVERRGIARAWSNAVAP
jgi:hypothetical protein